MKRCTSILKLVYAGLFFMMAYCPCWGQAPLKKLTPDDYHLWSKMRMANMSEKGNWLTYYLMHDDRSESFFVKNIATGKEYALAGRDGKFNGESILMFTDPQQRVKLLDLITGSVTELGNATKGDYASDGRALVTYDKDTENNKLVLRNVRGVPYDTIANVSDYKWNNAMNAILYIVSTAAETKLYIIDLKTGRRQPVAELALSNITETTWSPDGSAVAFYAESDDLLSNSVYYYHRESGRLYETLAGKLPDGMVALHDTRRRLIISDDGGKVFFSMRNAVKDPIPLTPGVEIWNGNDKILYPEKQTWDGPGYRRELAVWIPDSNLVRQITDQPRSHIMLCGGQEYAITGTTDNYDPQYRYDKEMDLYRTNLRTGHTKLLLERLPVARSQLVTSPDGSFVFYYKDGEWWSYSVQADTHYCLTERLAVNWDLSEKDPGNQMWVYGLAGFTDQGEVLINDAFDVWAIAADGTKARRVTNGREQNKQYRVYDGDSYHMPYNFSGYSLKIFSVDGLWLKTNDLNSGAEGYVVLKKRKFKDRTPNSLSATSLILAKNSTAYAFIDQRFDLPPRIVHYDAKRRRRILFQSNEHHSSYSWGTSKLVQYRNSKGEELNAALFYPADYDPGLNYPMVVYIYETVSKDVHRYVNPTLRNTIGFNISHLTHSGYFVLMPDMSFEKGNTGMSAVDCAESAVKHVATLENIDLSAVGILGHSFGGYEVNFIITHSKMFAAAVSGAAFSDVVSSYLTVHAESHNVNGWRYEKQQYRFGGTLYDDMPMYLRNSPIHHADKIETPLLLFAGKKDNNVRHEQSLEMYVALRRLKKKTILLLYPEEVHVQINRDTQIDLTERVGQWFDYFLKRKTDVDWISAGTM